MDELPILAYTYDLAGNRLTKALENGAIATSTYDAKGQLTLLAHEKSGATQAAFGYTYNSVGNSLPSTVRYAASGPQQGMPCPAKRGTAKVVNMQGAVRTESYTDLAPPPSDVRSGAPRSISRCPYGQSADAVDQVTGVDYGNSRTEGFVYDAVGNRISSTDSTMGTTSSTTNALNQYVSLSANSVSSGVNYDSRGNLAAQGAWTYTYDSKNRLLSAVSSGLGVNLAMTYDCQNRAVSRTLNGATRYFIYDGWSLIAEYNSTGDLVQKYVHGVVIDEILVKTRGTTDAFYHHDALGSTVLMTNDQGLVTRSYEYDAFGKVQNPPVVDGMFSADPYANRFLYTGREFLQEVSLYDYRNRVYSAELGRFLQSDPIRFDAGDVNLYRYVRNNPTNYIDPTGEFAWIAAGAAIGAVVNVGITYAANGGNVTGQQLAAAAASGAISGALGAAAGPLGGTIARGLLGTASNGLAASVASGALSAGGSALGQSAANAIDPCNATNPLNAALYGGLGGGLAKGLFPTRNLNTWAQAQAFGPKTVGGLFGSSNAWLNNGSFATSSGVGGAANFSGINPF